MVLEMDWTRRKHSIGRLPLVLERSLQRQSPTIQVQLLCSKSTRLFWKIAQRPRTPLHTVQTRKHMWCERTGSSVEAEIQPAGWTAPRHDVTSPLLFMNLFLSSAEPSEPKVPPQSKPLRQLPPPQHTPSYIHSPSQSCPRALLLPPHPLPMKKSNIVWLEQEIRRQRERRTQG